MLNTVLNGECIMRNKKQLEHAIEEIRKEYNVPGAIVALTQGGECVYNQSFGYRNIERELSITENTVFGLASITKSFTCIALMHLQEQGKISIHDPVKRYLPEFRLKDNQSVENITLHHFMTHSSGLPPMASLEYALKRPVENDPSVLNHVGSDQWQPNIDTYEQLMEYIANTEVQMLGSPGEIFSYSNESYGLLGAVIERASGVTYEQYIHDYIVVPCGMDNTYFKIDSYDKDVELTTSYGRQISESGDLYIGPDIGWVESTSMRATGLLKSTAKDMLRYAEIFINSGSVFGKQIISEKSVKQMMKPHIKTEIGAFYGYGLRIIPNYFGDTFIGHGGSLRSISSRFGVILEKGVAGIALFNVIGVPAESILNKTLNCYFNRKLNESHHKYELYDISSDRLKEYAGEYQSDEGTSIIIKTEDESLIFIVNNTSYATEIIKDDAWIVQFKHEEEIVEALRNEFGSVYAISFHTRIVRKKI